MTDYQNLISFCKQAKIKFETIQDNEGKILTITNQEEEELEFYFEIDGTYNEFYLNN